MNTKEQGSGVRGQGSEKNQSPKPETRNSKLIFITGGARSGKSAFALEMANQIVGARRCLAQSRRPAGSPLHDKKCYLATAQALDTEMEDRITKHKSERGDGWDCVEEPLRVVEKIKGLKGRYDLILFDCLTLWLSNLMLESQESEVRSQKSEVESLISACKKFNGTTVIVSNEVGLGIVPDNALARRFRDLAGTANQLFAKAADEVYFVVSGIPMKLK